MSGLTDAQLTWLEHRAQAALGPEIPVAAQAVTDMAAEIRSLRAQVAAIPWTAIHRVHMAAQDMDTETFDHWITVADWTHNHMPQQEVQP